MSSKTTLPFKFLGYYDVTPFIEKLDSLDWDAYDERQRTRAGMRDTFTYPLIWDINFKQSVAWPFYDTFANQVEELKDLMDTVFGPGEMQTCVLTNLPSGKKITLHYDRGAVFCDSHRVHIPIQTNPDVIFKVGDQELNMKVGSVWEINNSHKPHGVFNYGNTDRIHLMIDWKFDQVNYQQD